MRDIFEYLRAKLSLPVVGIVAFSGCSVNSLAHLLMGRAQHPTPVLWLAAALVELVTAWLVIQSVETARKVTRSNISRQDKRFYSMVLAAFTLLAVPSLGLSVWANILEFNSVALGFVFPLLSVACAIGAALPDTVARFETRAATERQEKAKARQQTARQRRQAEAKAEAERKALEAERQQAETERKELGSLLEMAGNAAETLRKFTEAPGATQAEIAATLGKSERTVRHHLSRLESLGIVKRNGGGIELLVDLPEGWDGNGHK